MKTESSRSRWVRIRRPLTWTLGTLSALIVVVGLVLSISNWNFARGTVGSILSSKLNREVSIEGALTAHLLSSRPSARVERLKIHNPKDIEGDLLHIEILALSINLRELLKGSLVLETLEVEKPQLALVSEKDGRNNIDFSDANDTEKGSHEAKKERKKPKELPDFPAVRRFTLRGGELAVRDEPHKLHFKGVVEASESGVRPEETPFRLRGTGELNNEPFALRFIGGPLANIEMDQPYAFDADVTAGKTHGSARGAFEKPFDFGRIVATMEISGENLAHLYALTSLALPFTPPYKLAGEVQSAERRIVIRKLDGKVGSSDLKGEVTVDLTEARPKLIAALTSRSLNLADLSAAVGKGVRVDAQGDVLDSIAPGSLPTDKLLPTFDFKFDRLRSMDAVVSLRAASVQTKKVPITGVSINLRLADGVLDLSPVVFSLPQGTLSGTVHVDAREKTARSQMDLRLADVKLDQFKGKQSQAPLDGVMHARMQLSGTGNSVHDLAAGAKGKLNAVIPHGEIRQAFAELTGINVSRGLGLLLTKDQQRANVRCGVASFNIQAGNADLEQLVFDTETVLIKGDGKINLGSEELDLDIEGHPKKVRLLRLRTPVTVNGTLRKPSIGIKAEDAAKQVGIAGVLGTLFAPLAAAVAFIDPGLAKDADCAALLAEAEAAIPKNRVSAVIPAK